MNPAALIGFVNSNHVHACKFPQAPQPDSWTRTVARWKLTPEEWDAPYKPSEATDEDRERWRGLDDPMEGYEE